MKHPEFFADRMRGLEELERAGLSVSEGTRNFVLFDPDIAKIIGVE